VLAGVRGCRDGAAGDCDDRSDLRDAEALTDDFGGDEACGPGDDELHVCLLRPLSWGC